MGPVRTTADGRCPPYGSRVTSRAVDTGTAPSEKDWPMKKMTITAIAV